MSYVTYKKSFYRTGFRPIATNPYAATQLGLIGQNRPFTRAGGYRLHGMGGLGSIVPDQSAVTWVGQISGNASQTVQDVVSAATAALAADGLEVVGSSGLPFSVFDINLQFSSSATVTLNILVNNGMGYSAPNDIAAIVNHELYVASGTMPTGTITVVTPPGGSAGLTPGGAAVGTSATTPSLTQSLENMFTPTPAAPGATTSSWLLIAALGVLGFVVIKEMT